MVKKEKVEIKDIRAPIYPVSPLFSNVVATSSHRDMVMLDFGFLGPSYFEPYGFEDNHISRICLNWDSAENLLKELKDAVSEHKKGLVSKKGTGGKRSSK